MIPARSVQDADSKYLLSFFTSVGGRSRSGRVFSPMVVTL